MYHEDVASSLLPGNVTFLRGLWTAWTPSS